jgi:hypothetical protein
MRFIIPILFITCLLIIQPAVAQKGFLPGYVVTLKGDTLYGNVKDRKENFSAVLFTKIKFTQGGLIRKKFGADKLIAYRRGTDDFESHWMDQQRERFREQFYSRTGEGKQVFLKRIVSGEYLRYYQFEFIDQEADLFESVPLFKRTADDYFVRVSQGVLGLKKKRLSEYFRDYPELAEQIRAGTLHDPREIVQRYNQWKAGLPSAQGR